jgi:HPr kinase/phosphorylase
MSEIATDVLLPVQRAVLHKDRVTRMTGQKITLHGVFIEVMQLGVLLSGASGAGKSELALELLNRGHRLIADDAPEFFRSASGGLQGQCPEPLRDFLEVRGLGVINIRAMFGDGAIAPCAELQLVLQLKLMNGEQLAAVDRLRPSCDGVTILEKEVPRITLPVAPGRNLAILAETAVRNQLLALAGYDASADFSRRQQLSLTQGDA